MEPYCSDCNVYMTKETKLGGVVGEWICTCIKGKKMKTKEMKVWVTKKAFVEDVRFFECYRDTTIPEKFKARLIVEIPEKKIEITEGEFDEAYNNQGAVMDINKLKKELGFKE